ncbi:MAG TPA: MFS transporter [Crinalium sp.]|jgi:MFS family permease
MRTRSQIDLTRSQSTVLWQAVGALAALYGSFTLGWVIYRVHLPGILTQFQLSAELAPKLLLIEALLAIAIEPLAGLWSDKLQQQQGNRFAIITQGILLASAFFVLIPALVLLAVPNPGMQWLLIGLLIVWAIAMSLFRSPALALLGRYASAFRLPQAASLLTLAGGIAGAAMPLGNKFILSLGIVIPSVIAAFLLLGSTAILRSFNPQDAPTPLGEADLTTRTYPDLIPRLLLIGGLGFSLTLAFRIAIETFPKLLKAQLPGSNPPLFVGLVFIAIAIAAIPGGQLAVRMGNRKIMLVSAIGLAIGLGLMPLITTSWLATIVAILIGASFSLITNGTLPFTLGLLPISRAGLAVGVFFSGVSIAASLFSGVLSRPGLLSPVLTIGLGIVALVLTGWCIIASRSWMPAR